MIGKRKKANATMAQYLELIPTPVVAVDRDFTITYVNPAGAGALGKTPEACAGEKCYDLFKTSDCNTAKCACGVAMREDVVSTSETIARLPGVDLPIRYTGTSLKDRGGKIIGALEFVIDISAEKAIKDKVASEIGAKADELTESSKQLAAAAAQAGQATNQISATSQQVARGAGEQSTALQETTQGVGLLSQAIEKISQGTREQAQSVEKNTEIVTQVSAAVEQIAKNAEDAAEGSKQAAENAGKGAQMARNTVEGMEKVKVSNANVSARVTELGDRSNEIGKIVATIDDIAAQTNLLALNAAIEAARAGEQGRGFAVVADEVRQLAERSSQATKEIADLIKGIQQSVSEAVSAMESGTVEVESGYQLATDAGNSLEEILGSSKAVGSQVEQISAAVQELTALSENMVQVSDKITKVVEENTAATEQMSASSDQVSRSVESVAGVSEENSAATEQVSASAQQMSAQVEEVVASSQSLAAMSEELQKAVSLFRVDSNGTKETAGAVSSN